MIGARSGSHETFQERISGLLDEAATQTDEMVSLRAATTTLDREKDALQAALDERAERAASLEDQLSRREREIGDLRSSISALEVHFLVICFFACLLLMQFNVSEQIRPNV